MALKELDELLLLAVLCAGGREVPLDRIVLAVEHRTGIRLRPASVRRALTRLGKQGWVSASTNGAGGSGRRNSAPVYSLRVDGAGHLREVLWRFEAMSRGVRGVLRPLA